MTRRISKNEQRTFEMLLVDAVEFIKYTGGIVLHHSFRTRVNIMRLLNSLSFAIVVAVVACSSAPTRAHAGNRKAANTDSVPMDIERLKARAFSACQSPNVAFVVEPVPFLDPPTVNGSDNEGLVYQEELAIRTANLLDKDGFYFSPRPRAAVNQLPMKIYVDEEGKGSYVLKTWDDANPDYSSSDIKPPINRDLIPPSGRVLSEVIIGHQAPQGGYPQLFDIRSSAYVRFAGYPPQITGASLRLGVHRIFGKTANPKKSVPEDFPVIRTMFMSLLNNQTARAFLILENQLFCGALVVDMTEGLNAEVLVDGYWYTRNDFNWRKDPHTGFVAYSSMLFKTEKQTLERATDEAHDSDTFRIKFADGTQIRYEIDPPKTGLRIQEFPVGQRKSAPPVEWILANEDRDPHHYADFKPALGDTNYDLRASYKVEILESSHRTGVSLFEHSPDDEYGDNLVAVSTLRQNIKKATNVDEFVRFKYKTTAFFPD